MIKTEETPYLIYTKTHPGMKGKQNEDRFGVSAFEVSKDNPEPVLLAVLSDGIGGHRAGEVAAEIVVEKISAWVAEATDLNEPLLLLQQAVVNANQSVYEESLKDYGRTGMGATCACVLIKGKQLFIASVGDSRIYLLRNKRLIQLSTDHTWIQEALDAGLIQAQEANGHPNAHVIRRYLGAAQAPDVDFRLKLRPYEDEIAQINNQGQILFSQDVIFLCSDGLTDLVSDQEIGSILEHKNLDDALEQLTGLANARGGHDNITMVAIKITNNKKHKSKKRKRWIGLLILFLVILTILAGLAFAEFGWPYLNKALNPTSAQQNVLPTRTAIIPSPSKAANTPIPGQNQPLVVPTSPTLVLTPKATPILWPTNTQSP